MKGFSLFSLISVASNAIVSVSALDRSPLATFKRWATVRNEITTNEAARAMLGKLKIAKTEDLSPQLNKHAVRKRIWYGPLTLPASTEMSPDWMPLPQFEGDSEGQQKGDLLTMKFMDPPCKDCLVLYGHTSMITEDGNIASIANGTYLHHTATLASGFGRPMDWTGGGFNCRKGEIPRLGGPQVNPFAPTAKAAHGDKNPMRKRGFLPGLNLFLVGLNDNGGNYFTDKSGKFKSGYRIKQFDSLMTEFEIMNYVPYQKKVYLALETEYIPTVRKDFKEVEFIMVNIQKCNEPVDFLLKGKTLRRESRGWILPYNGSIVSMMGHIHDGGNGIEINVNSKLRCNSSASYGTRPEWVMKTEGNKTWEALSGMVDCNEDPVPVKKGDNLTIIADYDLERHPMRMGNVGQNETVMGLAFLHIARG